MPIDSEILKRLERNDKAITELNLSGQTLTSNDIALLAKALMKNTSLTTLSLYGTKSDDTAVGELTELLTKTTTLKCLDLGGNLVTDLGAETLSFALARNTSLTILYLRRIYITDEGAKALANALIQNTTLKKLYLAEGQSLTRIGVKGAEAFAYTLTKNTSLTTLSLYSNEVTAAGAKAIANSLKINSTLLTLDLDYNTIDYMGADDIKFIRQKLIQNKALAEEKKESKSTSVNVAKKNLQPEEKKNLFPKVKSSIYQSITFAQETKNNYKSIGNEASVYKQQRTVLIEAIDKYLLWRKNKNVSDGRGYALGKFTKIRHFKAFGRERAEKLKENLAANLLNPIQLIQNHFRKDSTLGNHSLDTYILENILHNKKIFFITDSFFNFRTEQGRKSLRKFILEQNLDRMGEYAFNVALTYQENKTENHLQLAINYYAIALGRNYPQAFPAIQKIAKSGNAEAQYITGNYYYHRKKDLNEAVLWWSAAAEQGHLKASNYLFGNPFSLEQYLILAKNYEEGSGVKQNMNYALTFYEKAFSLNNSNAASRLGKYYEKDKFKSFEYYYVAAKQGDENALNRIEKIAEQMNDDKLHFKLAQVYLNHLNNPRAAFKIFKELADQKNADATQEINNLIKKNGDYACILGQLFEEEKSENHLVTACCFYIHANQNSHKTARERLDAIFNSNKLSAVELTDIGKKCSNGLDGIAVDYSEARRWYEKASDAGSEIARYELAIIYQEARGITKDNVKAIYYYQIAYNKGYAPAKAKLDTLLNSKEMTPLELTTIATLYLNGSDEIAIDELKALMLYQKAAERGDPSSALHLAQFYQVDHENNPKNIKLAYQFYLQAAKQGNYDALAPMERIAEETSADNQLALSQVYATFFHDPEKAEYWQNKANEIKQFDFKA